MKNYWILFTLLILSCSNPKNTIPDKDTESSAALIREFKVVFFHDCIAMSTNDKCVSNLFLEDNSVASDFPLGITNYKLIRSLAKEVSLQIHTDSIEWTNELCKDGCNEELLQRMKNEGMIGKKTFGTCLDYYTSNELDSIARANILK